MNNDILKFAFDSTVHHTLELITYYMDRVPRDSTPYNIMTSLKIVTKTIMNKSIINQNYSNDEYINLIATLKGVYDDLYKTYLEYHYN